MKKKTLLSLLAATMGFIFTVSATAQTSLQEEQAFRARQDEGARLHQTYGENSPQYQDWQRREKGGAYVPPQQQISPLNQGYPPGYQQQGGWGRGKKWKKKYNKWNSQNRNGNSSSNWNWDAHNWSDQRAYLRSHWGQHSNQLTAAQQQQLDNQMRAQWLQYHNNQNRWGNPTWNQYSDPGFLDYVHNRNPGLMQQIRTYIGF